MLDEPPVDGSRGGSYSLFCPIADYVALAAVARLLRAMKLVTTMTSLRPVALPAGVGTNCAASMSPSGSGA